MVDEAGGAGSERAVFPPEMETEASGRTAITPEQVAGGIALAVRGELVARTQSVDEVCGRLERCGLEVSRPHHVSFETLEDLGVAIVAYQLPGGAGRPPSPFDLLEDVAPVGSPLRAHVGVHSIAGFTPNHQGVDDPEALRADVGDLLLRAQAETVGRQLDKQGVPARRDDDVGIALVDAGHLQVSPKICELGADHDPDDRLPENIIRVFQADDIARVRPDGPNARAAGHGAMVGSAVAAAIAEIGGKTVRLVYEAIADPMSELAVVQQLAESLRRDEQSDDGADRDEPIDIANLSLCFYSYRDEPPLLLRAGLERFLTGEGEGDPATGRIVVTAAGNHGVRRPSYPAAYWEPGVDEPFDRILSVGALAGALVDTETTVRAPYSNRGRSVRLYAPGTAVGRYIDGPVHLSDGSQRRFEGYAEWSGTSFAAPYVAGVVAAAMQTGESAADAWRRLEQLDLATRHAIGIVDRYELHR